MVGFDTEGARMAMTVTFWGVRGSIPTPGRATARYGGYLRASLPPFWATTDPSVVREALARLHTPPNG